MTATNHALTGVVIALLAKEPELAIPLAFISHFAQDAVPHYNPPKVTKQTFINHTVGWSRKFSDPFFKYVFVSDMFLLVLLSTILPIVLINIISPWITFLCMLAAISPDFLGGRFLIYKWLGINNKHITTSRFFTRFHIWLQWMERPWGIYIELLWFGLMIWLINNLNR